jgi:hypothetical protein
MNNKKIKLNIQRISQKQYLILYPYNEEDDCGFGLLYNHLINDFTYPELADCYSFARNKNKVKPLVIKHLPKEYEKCFTFKGKEFIYIVIYESDSAVIIYCPDNFHWFKFTANSENSTANAELAGLDPEYIITEVRDRWPDCDFMIYNKKNKIPIQPINGGWFYFNQKSQV